ncbi:isopeptide-forming domain-containing fimbrial protein [Enterococcus cecorum]|nr:isopeptide-forming domain-containing fimbrial protein [Enterococcus cecorum]
MNYKQFVCYATVISSVLLGSTYVFAEMAASPSTSTETSTSSLVSSSSTTTTSSTLSTTSETKSSTESTTTSTESTESTSDMTVKEDSSKKQDKERKSKKDEEKFLKKLNRQKGDNVQFELDFDTGTWNQTPKTLTLKDPLDPGFIYQKSSIFLVDKDGKETDVTKSGELIYDQATHTVLWTIKATEEEPEKVNSWYNQKLIWRIDVQVKPDLELGNKHSLLLKNQGILLIDDDEYPTNPVTVEVTEEPPQETQETPETPVKPSPKELIKTGRQSSILKVIGVGIIAVASFLSVFWWKKHKTEE